MRSPTFTLGGTATLRRLYQKNFHTPKMYLTRLNVYKLQLSTSNNFRDMRGSQLYTRGAVPPPHILAEKLSYLKRVLGQI